MTTNRQKAAVRFCEQYLDVTFKGDINDFHQISKFLSIYLNTAKRVYNDITMEYQSYQWDLMMY